MGRTPGQKWPRPHPRRPKTSLWHSVHPSLCHTHTSAPHPLPRTPGRQERLLPRGLPPPKTRSLVSPPPELTSSPAAPLRIHRPGSSARAVPRQVLSSRHPAVQDSQVQSLPRTVTTLAQNYTAHILDTQHNIQHTIYTTHYNTHTTHSTQVISSTQMPH